MVDWEVPLARDPSPAPYTAFLAWLYYYEYEQSLNKIVLVASRRCAVSDVAHGAVLMCGVASPVGRGVGGRPEVAAVSTIVALSLDLKRKCL